MLVKVNDRTISQADLDRNMEATKRLMQQRGVVSSLWDSVAADLASRVLDGLVVQALLDGECAAKNITVSDEDVSKEIAGIKTCLATNTTLDAELRQQGITQDMLAGQVKNRLKLEKLLNVAVPDDEIKQFYDAYQQQLFQTARVRHILIQIAPGDEIWRFSNRMKAEGKANRIRQQLVEGADFGELARNHSACPSKEVGGVLPPFRRGQKEKSFEDMAFSLRPNEISAVFETAAGFQVLQTLEIRIQSLDEVKGRIRGLLTIQKIQAEIEPLLKNLRQKARIEYLPGAVPPS
jgi:parvulin-like peptidyl-prolyl isomerase